MDRAIAEYLKGPPPYKLEMGAGPVVRAGWISTDLVARTYPNGALVAALDATKDFEIPNNTFDYVYSEHMIEHIPFEGGLNMLEESYRVLKPGGRIRIVTPSIEFLERILKAEPGSLEDAYMQWSVRSFVPGAPKPTRPFFLNNFVRAWGHTFIYDRETLHFALSLAGFVNIEDRGLNDSTDPSLAGLSNDRRMPPGFLELESMVVEGMKPETGRVKLDGLVNVALGKPATQSSVSEWSRGNATEDASRVVNGKFDEEFNNHTSLEANPWWAVDLGGDFDVRAIRIYNRRSPLKAVSSRLNRFQILASLDANEWKVLHTKNDDKLVRGSLYSPFEWSSLAETPARYVMVQSLGETCLHLSQVEVLAIR
jgi:predicted SAM-dependent methyltransferase